MRMEVLGVKPIERVSALNNEQRSGQNLNGSSKKSILGCFDEALKRAVINEQRKEAK